MCELVYVCVCGLVCVCVCACVRACKLSISQETFHRFLSTRLFFSPRWKKLGSASSLYISLLYFMSLLIWYYTLTLYVYKIVHKIPIAGLKSPFTVVRICNDLIVIQIFLCNLVSTDIFSFIMNISRALRIGCVEKY